MLKFHLSFLLLVLGIVFFVFHETSFVAAQSYYGSRPAMSPWLGLSNRPTGVLDSYNQYVRPHMEIQKEFNAQQDQLNRQRLQQDSMSRQTQQLEQNQQQIQRTQKDMIDGSQGVQGVRTVGRSKPAASFRNYSHYYPNKR